MDIFLYDTELGPPERCYEYPDPRLVCEDPAEIAETLINLRNLPKMHRNSAGYRAAFLYEVARLGHALGFDCDIKVSFLHRPFHLFNHLVVYSEEEFGHRSHNADVLYDYRSRSGAQLLKTERRI